MHQLQAIIRRQLKAAWHYRWPAILFSWLICAAGWVLVLTIPNQYEASARMYVDADAVLTPLLRGLAVDSSLNAQVDMLQRTLLSRPNLEKLISKTDLELQLNGPSDRQALVERLSAEIRVTPQTRNLFTITYRNKLPKLAFDVVQNIMNTFVESKAGNNRSDLENASRFLQEQLTSYEAQLRDAEKRRAEFRARYVDVLPGADGGASKLEQARARVIALKGSLADEENRKTSLTRELANSQPTLPNDPAAEAAAAGPSRLQGAERTLAELRLKYTENHPSVVAQRQLVEAIRSGKVPASDPAAPRAAPRRSNLPNPVYEQLKLKVVDSDGTILSLQRQVGEATTERDRLEDIARSAPGLMAESQNMDRDYGVLRKNYDDLLARREAMRISSAAETGADKVKVQIIDPPQVPQNPVAPKRILLLTGVLLAGLAAGGALALLLVQMDQSFHSTEDLRDLGYPVVGGVSLLAAAVPFRRQLFAVVSFALAAMVPGVIYGGLLFRLVRDGTQV